MGGKRSIAMDSELCRAAKGAYCNISSNGVMLEEHGLDVAPRGPRGDFCPTRLMGEGRAGQVALRGKMPALESSAHQASVVLPLLPGGGVAVHLGGLSATSTRLQAHALLESCACCCNYAASHGLHEAAMALVTT